MKINAASFWSILKTLPFHFFGYKSNIFHPIDMANVLYQTCSIVQEKKYVKLVTNIKNGNTSHENPYFGLRDGGTWKQFKLDKGSWILQIKLVLAYLHRNNKYTMSKTYQKMLEVQFSYFHYWIRSITFPTRIPLDLKSCSGELKILIIISFKCAKMSFLWCFTFFQSMPQYAV